MDKHPLDEALELSQRGQLDDAEAILRTLPQHDVRVQYNLGYYDIRRGDLCGGLEKMNMGRWINVFGSPAISQRPIWKDESLHNKILLFHSEGGLGDHIINIRFAKHFHELGATVIVSTDPSLFPIISQLPWVSGVIDSRVAHLMQHDYWVPAMAAAYLLGLAQLDATPYIPRYPFTPSYKLKVGIRWSGNPRFEHEQNRRFDPAPLIALADMEDVQLYSFQRDDNIQELPTSVIDLQHELTTWSDTQRWLSEMDLVISSCTSVAHLSAAMGIPTWVIIPCLPYYTWCNPAIQWYESVILYQQETFGNWDAPLQAIHHDLYEKIQCMHTYQMA